MNTRHVSLRELVIEDCARIAAGAGYASIPRLLRRPDLDTADIEAASNDLRYGTTRPRAAGLALAAMLEEGAHTAAAQLAASLKLELAAWLAETCAEQGVELDEEVGV